MASLDKFFEDKTFINGERLTAADLAFASTLKHALAGPLASFKLSEFKNLNRYYNTVINQPDFNSADNLALFSNPASSQASADLLDALENAQKKPKDPFESLPPTTFNFDDYKRCYSNNPADVYLPYFWEKFDSENCSIWLCEYKFAEELGLVFMTSNLVRGALQRLDKARKQSFGSMCVYGKDKENTIAGLWIWRGQDLMFKLSEDWQVDYESYDWKKLDAKSDETKKLVDLFFQQKEDSEWKGMKFADGKIFK